MEAMRIKAFRKQACYFYFVIISLAQLAAKLEFGVQCPQIMRARVVDYQCLVGYRFLNATAFESLKVFLDIIPGKGYNVAVVNTGL